MSDINRSKESESSDHRPVDLSNLITSANHKQYLQLVPTTSLSDEDEQPSGNREIRIQIGFSFVWDKRFFVGF